MKQWDEVFKKEGRYFNSPDEGISKILELFKKDKAKTILDLGCGSGRHIIYLAERGFDVYGIDISGEGIKLAKKWLNEKKLKADLRIGNIYEKLPYKNNFFDGVVSTRVIHHAKIEKIRKMIKELERVLKPKGLIFITVVRHIAKKDIPKNRLYGIKYIAPRTYITLGGPEKGLEHYKFNKKQLLKEFNHFKIDEFWVESGKHHYCFIGRLKQKYK